MAKDKDYEVGYRKPPRHTQFKPGQSGNPGGRSKKILTEEEILLRELSAKVTITERGKERRVTMYEAIIKKQIHLAAKGDPRAVKFVTNAYKEAMAALAPVKEEVMTFTLALDDPDREHDVFGDDDPFE